MDAANVPLWVQAAGSLFGTGLVAGWVAWNERRKERNSATLPQPGEAQVVAATLTGTRELNDLRVAVFGALHWQKVVPHELRKNAVNTLLEVGCTVAETAAVSGQSLQIIEHYSRMRSGKRLSSAAMGKWEDAA